MWRAFNSIHRIFRTSPITHNGVHCEQTMHWCGFPWWDIRQLRAVFRHKWSIRQYIHHIYGFLVHRWYGRIEGFGFRYQQGDLFNSFFRMTVLPDKLCKFPVIVHTGKTFGFLSNLLQLSNCFRCIIGRQATKRKGSGCSLQTCYNEYRRLVKWSFHLGKYLILGVFCRSWEWSRTGDLMGFIIMWCPCTLIMNSICVEWANHWSRRRLLYNSY